MLTSSIARPLAAAFLLLAPTSCAMQNAASHEGPHRIEISNDRIDDTLRGMVEAGEVAGVSALIFQDGAEVYFGAFGFADRESNIPMRRDTLVQIWSMTKPVTGVALMTLYEEGKFNLDDPIAMHIPELANLKVYGGKDPDGAVILKKPARQPVVADFLRHTAGLMAGSAADENPDLFNIYRSVDATAWSGKLNDMPAKMAKAPLLYSPGERWLYSDAVDVQAVLVERLSGRDFGDYVREEIIAPLKMQETWYLVPEEHRGRLASVYSIDEAGALQVIPRDEALRRVTQPWPYTPGSFGLVSSLDDYMRFAQMLVSGGALDGARILKPETVRMMASDLLPSTVGDRSWLPSKGQVGFGVNFAVRTAPPVNADENAGAVGEFFWDGAASTLFWVDPANDLTAVLFLQRMPFYGEAHKTFRDSVYGPFDPAQGIEAPR